jgi:hypothetical protein
MCTSCFIAGTMVLMADGALRPIEDIAVGDRVLAGDGINIVKELEVVTLGERSLYSINGGAEFVTAEHPFFTMDGWQSIDPDATRAENPDLHPDVLRVGSVLKTSVGGLKISQLDGGPGPDDLPLFNLILGDGDHSYWVLLPGTDTSCLVHNKGGAGGGVNGKHGLGAGEGQSSFGGAQGPTASGGQGPGAGEGGGPASAGPSISPIVLAAAAAAGTAASNIAPPAVKSGTTVSGTGTGNAATAKRRATTTLTGSRRSLLGDANLGQQSLLG